MTFLEAARLVLEEANAPLHYVEITRRAQEKGILTTSGATPDATMGSRLYTISKEPNSEFVRESRGLFSLARAKPKDIDQQIEAINQKTKEQLRQKLWEMSPKAFEALILDLLIVMGFDESTVTVTPYSGDGGIDVRGVYHAAGLTRVNAAVQAKRWKGNVTAPQVQGVRGAITVDQQGIIITTSGYSRGAKEEAVAPGKMPIGLIDGDELVDLLVKHRVGVIDKTHTVIQLDEERWGAIEEDDKASTDIYPQPPARPLVVIPDRAKPQSVRIFGESYSIDTWKQGLLKVAEALYKRDPVRFEKHVFGLRGRKRVYVGPTGEGMYKPAQVSNLPVYIEINQSRASIMDCANMMVEAAGFASERVEWILRD